MKGLCQFAHDIWDKTMGGDKEPEKGSPLLFAHHWDAWYSKSIHEINYVHGTSSKYKKIDR